MKDYRTWWRRGDMAADKLDGLWLGAWHTVNDYSGFLDGIGHDNHDCVLEQMWAEDQGLA